METPILRILDANLNRAGEALRVLEEHARMVLNDAALSARAKQLRHDLADARSRLPARDLLESRDVAGDVGTCIGTPSEHYRTDTLAVATAAARRATESLRCLEEYGKTLENYGKTAEEHGKSADSGFAFVIERIRYDVYTLERDLALAGPARARLRQARLHVLITESFCAGPWLDVAAAAIDGGADVIQLREKDLPDRELLARATQLRELTTRRGVLLTINDRPDIARLVSADIVHVGQDDLPVAAARAIAGPAILVGKSTHSIEQVRAALEEQPDYIAVGPMFASQTKPASSDIASAGPPLLSAAVALTNIPIVAIGGIDARTAALLDIRSSVQIAVCQAVIAADDTGRAAHRINSIRQEPAAGE